MQVLCSATQYFQLASNRETARLLSAAVTSVNTTGIHLKTAPSAVQCSQGGTCVSEPD